jgi:hypothetical protein
VDNGGYVGIMLIYFNWIAIGITIDIPSWIGCKKETKVYVFRG